MSGGAASGCSRVIAGRAVMKGVAGFVIDGAIRDVRAIEKLALPVFARAVTPAGPYKHGPGAHQVPIALGGQSVAPGDVIVGDDDGVAVIPFARLEQVVRDAEAVRENEERKRESIGAWNLAPASEDHK